MTQKQKLDALIKELEVQLVHNLRMSMRYPSQRDGYVSSMLTVCYVLNEISSGTSPHSWNNGYIDAVVNEVYPNHFNRYLYIE